MPLIFKQFCKVFRILYFMSKLKLLLHLSLLALLALASADEIDAHNINELKHEISEVFGIDSEEPFSKSLRNLPDFEATTAQIENIVGQNFSIVYKQWEEIQQFATNLVIGPMKKYQEIFTETDPKSTRVFTDFYDMIKVGLSPETIAINKEVYLTNEIVDQETFNEIYTKLMDYYKHWPPIFDYIESEKKIMLERIKRLTLQKHPDYTPTQLEVFPNTVSQAIEPEFPEIKKTSIGNPIDQDKFIKLKTDSLLKLQNKNITTIVILNPIDCSSRVFVPALIGIYLLLWVG